MNIKKQKLKRIFKTRILFLGVSLLIWNCQDEEIQINQENQKLVFSTVSKSTAKTIFESYFIEQEKTLNQSTKQYSVLEILPNWNSFKQQDLSFTDALLSTIDVKTNALASLTSKLVFLNVDDKTLRVIESKHTKELDGNKIKEGHIYYHNLDGKFILGLKVENGLITKKLIKSKTVNKAGFLSMLSLSLFMQDCDEDLDPNSEFCNNTLEEVVVTGSATTEASVYWIIYGGSGGYNDYDYYGQDSWDTGGGGGGSGNGSDDNPNTACTGGKIYNYINGNCECPDGYFDDGNGACLEITVENVPPDCESFEYSRVGTTNWQTAGVSGIHELFTVFNWKCTGYDFGYLPQAIYFQLPINSTFTLDSGYTKTESAATLHQAFKAFDVWYKNNACSASASQMTAKFLETIKDEFEEIGGNATVTPPLGYTGSTNVYKYKWVGYGNCY